MNFRLLCVFYLLPVLMEEVFCKLTAKEVSNLIQTYEASLKTSLELSKNDRALLTSWSDHHQIQQVNVTTKFRLQMTRHKEHNFGKANTNRKWTKCKDFYADEIKSAEHFYYKEEMACLKSSNAGVKEKRKAVDQVEREIKNWRKTYKYLSHLCEVEYANDAKTIKACLVGYIEKDQYNALLDRLFIMKIDVMMELSSELTSAIANLEECLNTVLSKYLDKVRTVMNSLYRCYNGLNND